MKKTFLTKRNALLSSASASCGAFAIAVAIGVLLMRLLVPNVFWYAFSPALNISHTLGDMSHAFFASFGNVSVLTLRNEEIIRENTALANENAVLRKQAESLSALLGAPAPLRGAGILASVLARPPESPYDTLVISSGSAEGVTNSMEAFGDGGVPLGIVSAVMSHYSRVTLFSAPRMTVSGWVGNANIPINIRGEGAGAMSASVSRSTRVAVGDIVYAPGPGMLPIGSVARVNSDPSSPSVTLRIQLSLNLFSLGWVELRDVGKVFFSATSTLP